MSILKVISILKSRDITLPTKVHPVKAMVFPVVMYGYESWTIKKAECRRIDAFELWCWRCWRRLLRVPWTAKRSNQSTLMEISLKYSLEGLMLKLKPQYFGHLMWRTDSLEKTLMPRKIEVRMRRGEQRMRWLDGITNSESASSGSWWWIGKPGVLQSTRLQRVGHNSETELLLRNICQNNYLKLQEMSSARVDRRWSTKRFPNSSYGLGENLNSRRRRI